MRFWYDAESANKEIESLQMRNAFLERMAMDMAKRCIERQQGYCDLNCLGRAICEVSDLKPKNG